MKKFKIINHILVITLSLLIVVGTLPTAIFAATAKKAGEYTINVVNENNEGLEKAQITYKIIMNDVVDYEGTVTTTNGIAVIDKIKDYENQIDSKSVILSYEVSLTEYQTQKGKIDLKSIEGEQKITLQKDVAASAKVTVKKSGNGEVKINDNLINESNVALNTSLFLKITPDLVTNGLTYIKSLKIDSKTIEVEKYQSYQDKKFQIQKDTVIEVEFSTDYEVNMTYNQGGNVTINDQAKDSCLIEKGDKAMIKVKPNKGYQIGKVEINGVEQPLNEEQLKSYEQELTVEEKTLINVSFVKLYTVKVSYDATKGTVNTDPACVGGKIDIEVEEGKDITIKAIPNANYRVSSVVKNKKPFTFETNDYIFEETILDIDEDWTYEISFAFNVYKVSSNIPEHGKIDINQKAIDYGGSTKICITPDEGYVLKSVSVNQVEQEPNREDENSYSIIIKNIKENQKIDVVFVEMPKADMADISFNVDKAIRQEGNLYVFAKDQAVVFTTKRDGIRINGIKTGASHESKESKIITSTDITSLEVFYKEELEPRADWHSIELPNGGIQIIIDKTAPEVEIKPDVSNKNGYYNENINVEISSKDSANYSGIATIEYWITSNGNETQHEIIKKDGKQNTVDKIMVDASLNNSDQVKVRVEVKDLAGNITNKEIVLKINVDRPKVQIDIDGKQHPDALAGNYNIKRTAKITIIDRADTFDTDAATKGIIIKKDGESINNISAMVSSWQSNNDTHWATIHFVDDGSYEWEFSYINKADLENEAVAITGDHAYSFTIDTKAPTGVIEMESSIWDKVIETLTFGIWKNTAMTAIATGYDAITAIQEISYYKSNSTDALSEVELDAYYQNGKFQTEPVTIDEEEHFVIYARLCDEAGNYTYISTNGAIVDVTPSNITLTPEKANSFGFYNRDVKVGVQVSENDGTGSFSGIKKVTYHVESLGEVTQEGELYSFSEKEPTLEQLKKEFSDEIIIDSSLNNSDEVNVIVTTIDNAGNENEKQLELAINTEAPKIKVEFSDKANRVEDETGYFPQDRIAIITIYDRYSTFNEMSIMDGIHIVARDHDNKKVDIQVSDMLSEWTHQGNEHQATIRFSEDAVYSWDITYTNKADMQLQTPVDFNGVTPVKFAVDKNDPFGTLTVGQDTNSLFRILEVLTFGAFKNDSITISATGNDATSPVIIEYYKTDQATPIGKDELDRKEFKKYKSFQVDQDEQFFIYLKITDYAGNYIYINSDGYVLDKQESKLSYKVEGLNENGIAKDDVNISLEVTDPEPYAGIHSIEYWVEKDGEETQRDNLFQFDIEHPSQAQLEHELKRTFTVDAKLNNSCDVVAYIKVIDNAGNEMLEEIPIDIDITAPEIKLSYDNNAYRNHSYFNRNRTATVTITERTHHFNEQDATKGIDIQAVDAKGNKVNLDLNQMISEWTTKEGNSPDEATHTAIIEFSTDANYTLEVAYTDKAGLENKKIQTSETHAPFEFTIDKQEPTGTITGTSVEGRVVTWNALVDNLTFGFWSGQKIILTQSADDMISPIESVSYYKTSETKALDRKTLEKVNDWNDFTTFEVIPNEQFTVYVRVIDYAGNTTYISSDGMIVDDTAPREEAIAPEITIKPQQPVHGLYNRDVAVSIQVDDPTVKDTYSGLKNVNYRVLNMGKVTQSGTLYAFENKQPTQNDLQKSWSGSIVVDADKNNSNDVVIEVSAQDNALNFSKDQVSIKIDVTAPVVEIEYDNNNPDAGKYYQKDRIAQIKVTERNFNEKDVKIKITNTDGSIPKISDWKEQEGTGNQDDSTHTATIRYHDDGDYTFAIAYTDLADNVCEKEQYVTGTTNPTTFTIDQTAPEISVSYDNNQVINDKYFAANRRATLVVKEHNFNRERVNFAITSTLDGNGITNPSISWSDNGDVHTAVIAYEADGDYTFDVKMNDLAGNVNREIEYGSSAAPKDFTIDTNIQEPIIGGVENGHSYKDEVIPVISFSDTNYDSHEVRLTRTKMNEIDVDVTNEFITGVSLEGQGGTGSYDTFKKEQDNDGIYTLYVKVMDKAGNNIDKSVTFTVNRYGSVYEFDNYLVSLIKDGGAYVQQIDNDIIITEYNADSLLEDSLSIEITKDGKPIPNVAMNVSPAINTQVTVGDSGWYQYRYTIDKSNFNSDGVYKMAIASKDTAGNASENMNYKDKDILFRVDKTTPEITSITGLETAIVNAQDLEVNYELYDTIGLKSVTVYVDNERINSINDFTNDQNHFNGKFTLTEKSSSQDVRLVVEDLAGNITDTDDETFTSAYQFEHSITVSTNLFVRWYANKPLFIGSIIGVAGLGAALCFMILKKKKEVEEKV